MESFAVLPFSFFLIFSYAFFIKNFFHESYFQTYLGLNSTIVTIKFSILIIEWITITNFTRRHLLCWICSLSLHLAKKKKEAYNFTLIIIIIIIIIFSTVENFTYVLLLLREYFLTLIWTFSKNIPCGCLSNMAKNFRIFMIFSCIDKR